MAEILVNTQTTGEKKPIDIDSLGDLEKNLYRDYSEDLAAHDISITDFDGYEAMHMGKTYDSTSRQTTNGLTDSATATIYLERAARVAGQLPDGEVQAFGKHDTGKGLFMDLLRTKWIYPNANAQRDLKTKMFMWQYGSSEYGFMPMYVDLNVSANGYFGPDCWLWNPRNFIPQNGCTSIGDMDYCHALVYKSTKYFEDLIEDLSSGDDADDDEDLAKIGGWDLQALKDVIEQIRHNTRSTDPKRDTLKVRTREAQQKRQTCIATRYEAGEDGHWVSFLPDYGMKVIRNIKNPHENSRLPWVIKPCVPTFDSFYNIGDFQRSMPMQFANDGLDNFYFQGIKINLFPPTVVSAMGIIRHTISNEPGAVWEVTNNVNDVKRLETSTAGLQTYQAAKTMAKGAIQSIAGTTTTDMTAQQASDPAQGKTPEAIKANGEKEDTRDNQDREMLEIAEKELFDLMFTLIPVIENKIPVDLFQQEIADIISNGNTDLEDIFKSAKSTGLANYRVSDSKKQLRLRIDPKKFKGLEYKFQLEPNSTAKTTKQGQLNALVDFLGFVGKMPNALQDYKLSTNRVPNWDYIFKQYGDLADVSGMDKMFMPAPPPPPPPPAPEPRLQELINYKDAPDDIRRQIEVQAGLKPSAMPQATQITDPSPKGAEPDGSLPEPGRPTDPTDPRSHLHKGIHPLDGKPSIVVAGHHFKDPAIAAEAAKLEALKHINTVSRAPIGAAAGVPNAG